MCTAGRPSTLGARPAAGVGPPNDDLAVAIQSLGPAHRQTVPPAVSAWAHTSRMEPWPGWRVSTSTRGRPNDDMPIPFNGDETDNEYSHNMQIADLNALNAAVAAVRWKKVIGFYSDQEGEHFSTCALAANKVRDDERE